MKEQSVFKNTTDDWYGNYPGNQVKLEYIGKLSDGTFRVACWGNDDFGLENQEDAYIMYSNLKNMSYINKTTLYNRGFNNA
jgi:hypothetical protein